MTTATESYTERITRERADTERRDKAITAGIAAALGTGWTVRHRDDEEYRNIIDGINYSLYLHVEGYGDRGRVRISAGWPMDVTRHKCGDGTDPEITASMSKTPGQIARDIERRIIPAANERDIALRAAKASADAYESRQAALAADLAGILGTSVDVRNGQHEVSLYGQGPVSGKVEVYADHATMTIRSVPGDLAAIICKAIADYRSIA